MSQISDPGSDFNGLPDSEENGFSPEVPEGFRYGFILRSGAAVIDHTVIMLIISFVAVVTVPYWKPLTDPFFDGLVNSTDGDFATMTDDSQAYISLLRFVYYSTLVTSLIVFVYFLTELFWGTSPGKFLLGMKISGVSSPASFGQLATRWLLKFSIIFISTGYFAYVVQKIMASSDLALDSVIAYSALINIITFAYIIGCCFIFSGSKQTFYDMISKTVVVGR